jgi:hypothetical protein
LPQIIPFALISLVSFLLGAVLLFFMVWKAERLVAIGLTGRLYYIVLLPLGLSVAAFLFGVLRSYAIYHGGQVGGRLILSGSVVTFFLVVILGFALVPDHSTFSLTVYVHGPAGLHDIVLKNSGEVWMDLAEERKRVQIGDAGQAYFPAIPAKFHSREVPISVSSDKFEAIQPKVKLDTDSVYLAVRRKAGRIFGRVESKDPNCLAGAQVLVAGLSAPVDSLSGNFNLNIPGDRLQDGLVLEARSPRCISDSYNVVPDSNEVTISLRKIPPDVLVPHSSPTTFREPVLAYDVIVAHSRKAQRETFRVDGKPASVVDIAPEFTTLRVSAGNHKLVGLVDRKECVALFDAATKQPVVLNCE